MQHALSCRARHVSCNLHIDVWALQVLQLAQDNPKYKAIDRAIGKESFKVVTLLRLSPLLPLALSNYFYGITRYAVPPQFDNIISRFS